MPHADRSHGSARPRHNASGTALDAYLAGTRRYELMSREEEHEIACRFVLTRDRHLRNRLVNANLRLVLKLALEYKSARRKLQDLVQEGNLGLLHALEKYDPHRGVKLGSYAAWWIRAYILKFIMSDARLLKVGTTQAQRRLFYGLGRARAKLELQGGSGAADDGQIARSLGVSVQDVEQMQGRMSSPEVSLERPSSGEAHRPQDASNADAFAPDTQVESREFNAALNKQVVSFGALLHGRDLVIFRKRLVCDEATTLAAIACDFGISRERVRQLEERLKARFRRHLRATLGDAVPGGCPRSGPLPFEDVPVPPRSVQYRTLGTQAAAPLS